MADSDDDQKVAVQNSDDSQQQPAPVTPAPPTPAPAAPVGGGTQTKESEPAASALGKSELKTHSEQKLSPEVIDYIKKQEESIKVPEALKNMGVSAGVDEDLVVDGPHLPISDTKIVSGLGQPVNSSIRWLAELALFILKQAHYTVKLINGHIKRIIYTGKN